MIYNILNNTQTFYFTPTNYPQLIMTKKIQTLAKKKLQTINLVIYLHPYSRIQQQNGEVAQSVRAQDS